MRRSFMTGLASLAFIATIGCDGTMFSLANGRPFKLISLPLGGTPEPTSQPSDPALAAKPSVSAIDSTETVADNDPALARLNETVSQFVARFPPADPTRPTQAQASPTTLPAADNRLNTNANPPPSPVNAAEPTQVAAEPITPSPEQVAPTPVDPTATATTNANASAHIEATASPQPPAGPESAEPSPNQPRVEIVDIRSAPEPVSQNEADNKTLKASANQPAENDQRPASDDLAQMITQLEASVLAHPQQLDDQFKLRLLYLATGQKDRALATFKDVDPVQAEVLSALFKTMAGAQDALCDPANGTSQAMTAVADLHRLLADQAPVMINKIALVTAVNSFGDYKAVQPPLFPPGQPVHVFCYCEIGNFRSEPTTDGRLRTLLAAALEVYDPTGRIVWQQKVPQIEDLVHTPRRDFFVPLEIKLPSTLAPGEYVLKVTIEDKLAATTDQQRLTFTIGK